MVISHLHVCWCCIIFPIGTSISNHETFEVWFENCWVSCMDSIMMMDSIYCKWNIHSTVWFSRNVEVILFKFWEFIEPSNNRFNIVSSHTIIIKWALFRMVCSITPWVTNSCWLFDVKNIGFKIPWVIILNHWGVMCRAIFNQPWTMLLDKCKHRRASWTSIKPNNERILWWIALTFS